VYFVHTTVTKLSVSLCVFVRRFSHHNIPVCKDPNKAWNIFLGLLLLLFIFFLCSKWRGYKTKRFVDFHRPFFVWASYTSRCAFRRMLIRSTLTGWSFSHQLCCLYHHHLFFWAAAFVVHTVLLVQIPGRYILLVTPLVQIIRTWNNAEFRSQFQTMLRDQYQLRLQPLFWVKILTILFVPF
jgi:hypothetical protein